MFESTVCGYLSRYNQVWDSRGSVRLPEPSPLEISRTRSCSDTESYSSTRPGSGSVSNMVIVGRVILFLSSTPRNVESD